MKKGIYIFCFVILGIILQQIIHAIVEMVYIRLLLADFNTYSLGLSWDSWFMIHHVGSVLLLMAGIIWGYRMGGKSWAKEFAAKIEIR